MGDSTLDPIDSLCDIYFFPLAALASSGSDDFSGSLVNADRMPFRLKNFPTLWPHVCAIELVSACADLDSKSGTPTYQFLMGIGVYTWPESETKCSRVPFQGLSHFTIDPSGEYALFTTKQYEWEDPPASYWKEPMEIRAFEFRSKKMVTLATRTKRQAIFEWTSNESVTAALKTVHGYSFDATAEYLKWDLKDIKAKLQTTGKVWSEPKKAGSPSD